MSLVEHLCSPGVAEQHIQAQSSQRLPCPDGLLLCREAHTGQPPEQVRAKYLRCAGQGQLWWRAVPLVTAKIPLETRGGRKETLQLAGGHQPKNCSLPSHRGGNAVLSLLHLACCMNHAFPWIALMSMFWRCLQGECPYIGVGRCFWAKPALFLLPFAYCVRSVSALQVQLPSPILMCCNHHRKTQYFNACCMLMGIFKCKAIPCWLARSLRRQ